MRRTYLLAFALVALACGEARERAGDASTGVDAGPAECRYASTFVENAPCALRGTCFVDDGCCATTWRCESSRLVAERRCGLPGCFTTCAEALASGESGDPCEGAYFCSSFDDRLCCERTVECMGGRLVVDDECGAGCATGD